MTPSLTLRDLEVLAGTRVVAGPLSLEHGPGPVLWLTGENGAGKSSVLRAIARGAPHRGHIVLSPPAARVLCYYAPTMHFAAGVTVRDWIALHERWQRASHHAELVDALLPPGLSGRVLRLSTGEAKRLALWSLLRARRSFYILDEPFEHLSPTAKGTLKSILAALAPEAVVAVATNQDIPADVPARVLELD
ncbi:MAG TPA: ATP-binding cassette domain-containing protein [Longimicrobiales bacterium]